MRVRLHYFGVGEVPQATMPGSNEAFSFIELLAVIAVLILCTPLILPALTHPYANKSKASQCMSNLRQLMFGILLYSHDYSDLFPPNPDDGNTTAGHMWCPGLAGPGGGNEYDPDLLKDERRNLIFGYAGREPLLYRCPADPRTNSRPNGSSASNPAYAGKRIPTARTVSMSGAVGTICPGYYNSYAHSGKPALPVDGPWLDNWHAHHSGQPWRTYGKTTQIVAPVPNRLIILLDENVVGLNDATFSFGMNTAEWIDFPGVQHDMAGTFAFGDGHTEVHKWKDQRTKVSVPQRIPVPGSLDWLWMKERISARAE